MSSTPDPRYGAILEIVTRLVNDPGAWESVGPYVDEILASIDSVHVFDDVAQPQSADDAHLRAQAVDLALRATGGGTGDTVVQEAAVILAFLRGEQPAAVPALRAVVGVAPGEVHVAIDRVWSTLRQDESGLKALEGEDGDADVREALRGLSEDGLRRANFALQVASIVADGLYSRRLQ